MQKERHNMAKIDTTAIEGFADMSAEEKVNALMGYDFPDPDYSGYVSKNIYDKTASDLAQKKKELNKRLSEEEQAKQAQAEAMADLQDRYNQLLRETETSKYKTEFVEMGYDSDIADKAAKACADKNIDAVLKLHKQHLENLEKKYKTDSLKNTPKPTPDGASRTMTLEKLRQMNPTERLEFYSKHPDEYKELYGGNK